MKGHRLEAEETANWLPDLAPPFSSCMTLNKSYNSQITCEMGQAPSLSGDCKDEIITVSTQQNG